MKLFLATGCGLGRFPFGGSLASLAACLIAVVFEQGGHGGRLEFAALAAFASLVCLATGGAAEAALGRKDPSEVVADEFAGMWLAFAIAPPGASLLLLLAGFAAFRFLDGLKPLGISKLQAIPGASGILVDDLVAGAAAGGVVFALSLVRGC